MKNHWFSVLAIPPMEMMKMKRKMMEMMRKEVDEKMRIKMMKMKKR